MEDECYQSVIITFSNGQVGTFTGPVAVHPEDVGTHTIRKIEFTIPKKLPQDAKFGRIDE